MLLFILIAVLSIIHTSLTTFIVPQNSDILTKQQSNTINITDVLNRMVTNITSRDPYIVKNFEGKFTSIDIKAENLTIRGFSNLNVSRIKLVYSENTSTVDFRVKVNNMSGSCDHWSADTPVVWGSGRFDFYFETVKINVTAIIDNASRNITEIKDVTKIIHPNVTITGIYDDTEVSNDCSAFMTRVLKLCVKRATGVRGDFLKVLKTTLQYILHS